MSPNIITGGLVLGGQWQVKIGKLNYGELHDGCFMTWIGAQTITYLESVW